MKKYGYLVPWIGLVIVAIFSVTNAPPEAVLRKSIYGAAAVLLVGGLYFGAAAFILGRKANDEGAYHEAWAMSVWSNAALGIAGALLLLYFFR